MLADGMGGYNAGEVASGMAVDVIRQSVGSVCKTLNMKTGRVLKPGISSN